LRSSAQPSGIVVADFNKKYASQGYKVALTGEGADEWLAGYPWYKVHRLLSMLDAVPGLPLSQLARRAYLRWRTSFLASKKVQ
jgi:asparagine synthetase B (glutamine-hydrolysing)